MFEFLGAVVLFGVGLGLLFCVAAEVVVAVAWAVLRVARMVRGRR